MSIGYISSPNEQVAVVVWDGLVTLDQWQSHLDKMLADPNYTSKKLQMTDLRFSIIDPSITDEQIENVVNFIAARQKMISLNKVAIVAGTDWAKTKLAERFIQMLSITPIVFTDLATACLWLGVDVVQVGQNIKQVRIKLRQDL